MQSKELRDYDNIPLLGYANKRYCNSPIVRTQEHLEAKRVAVTWIPAAAPLIALALFVVTAIHVRLAYGQWPMDAIDKPTTVLLALNMALFAVVSAVSMFLAGPVWLTLLFFSVLSPPFCLSRPSSDYFNLRLGCLFLGAFRSRS